jgi:hypothetical protein
VRAPSLVPRLRALLQRALQITHLQHTKEMIRVSFFETIIDARTRARRASSRAPPSRMAPSAAARAASAAAASRRASPAAAVTSASRAAATAAASDAVVFAATASAAANNTSSGSVIFRAFFAQQSEPSYLRPGRRPARPPGAPSAQPAWPNADEPPPGPRSAMAQ